MHILVVDDDQAVRDSLKRSLQYSGYEVASANDGIEALAHLSSHKVDAVIMDVMMPRMDGIEATRQIRALPGDESRTPIIAVTAHTDGENREACHAAGKYVGICGQGPSDHPDLAEWLLEQGIASMSLNPDTVVDTWLRLAKLSGG